MKHIFLDFDRTLFDTEAFYNSLELTYIEGIIAGQLGADLSRFIYPDVISFMCNAKEAGYYCHLVTFGSRNIQECKVKLSGLEPYFTELFYVERGSKAAVIKNYLDSDVSCEKAIFVDDTIEHLERVGIMLPQIVLIRMTRPGAKGSEVVEPRFAATTTFSEVGLT